MLTPIVVALVVVFVTANIWAARNRNRRTTTDEVFVNPRKAKPGPKKRKKTAEKAALRSKSVLVPECTRASHECVNASTSRLGGSTEHETRVFTHKAIEEATQNFKEQYFRARDFLGRVYIGTLNNEVVAVKAFIHDLTKDEVAARASSLSKADHPNLAKVIGYCYRPSFSYVVYEYPSGGTLEHFFVGEKFLNWKARMRVPVGVARALEYLEMFPALSLHLYVIPANIWLTEEHEAKLASYGIVNMQCRDSFCFYGAHGLARKDYELTGEITAKADVYSFGVVLSQLITGRTFTRNPQSGLFPPDEVRRHLEQNSVMKIVDPALQGDHKELYRACKVAFSCLHVDPTCRPTAGQVVEMMNGLGD